jgi:hypothetical protein
MFTICKEINYSVNSPPSYSTFKDLCFWSVAIQNHVLKFGRNLDEGPSQGHDNRNTEETRIHYAIVRAIENSRNFFVYSNYL